MRYPSFTVGPYFSQERASDREQQVGIGISMPLPLWNRNEGNIETAMARQQQAETSMYVTQRTVERQVVEQALTYQTKLTEMAKWRPESVAEFRKAAELADRHYRLGAVPIATYVELQKQYLEAVEALLDTQREALEAGQQLELLTGLDINAVRTNPLKREASANLETLRLTIMIDRILEFSLRQPGFVLLAAVVLLAAGLWSALHLPIDAVPDITAPQVQVNTEVPALAAEESEKLVTQPIEIALAGLPGVEEMRSLTKFGLSQVTIQFKDGTDIYRARQLVAERLQGVLEQLPAGALPKLAPISTGLGEIFYYSVNYRADATNKPATELEQLIELSEIQEYVIKPLLRTVPGIAEINESGGYEKQFVIQPKPDALADSGHDVQRTGRPRRAERRECRRRHHQPRQPSNSPSAP